MRLKAYCDRWSADVKFEVGCAASFRLPVSPGVPGLGGQIGLQIVACCVLGLGIGGQLVLQLLARGDGLQCLLHQVGGAGRIWLGELIPQLIGVVNARGEAAVVGQDAVLREAVCNMGSQELSEKARRGNLWIPLARRSGRQAG